MNDGYQRRSAGRRSLYPLSGSADLSPLSSRDKEHPRGESSPPRRPNQNTDCMNASSADRDDLSLFRLRILRFLTLLSSISILSNLMRNYNFDISHLNIM